MVKNGPFKPCEFTGRIHPVNASNALFIAWAYHWVASDSWLRYLFNRKIKIGASVEDPLVCDTFRNMALICSCIHFPEPSYLQHMTVSTFAMMREVCAGKTRLDPCRCQPKERIAGVALPILLLVQYGTNYRFLICSLPWLYCKVGVKPKEGFVGPCNDKDLKRSVFAACCSNNNWRATQENRP